MSVSFEESTEAEELSESTSATSTGCSRSDKRTVKWMYRRALTKMFTFTSSRGGLRLRVYDPASLLCRDDEPERRDVCMHVCVENFPTSSAITSRRAPRQFSDWITTNTTSDPPMNGTMPWVICTRPVPAMVERMTFPLLLRHHPPRRGREALHPVSPKTEKSRHFYLYN